MTPRTFWLRLAPRSSGKWVGRASRSSARRGSAQALRPRKVAGPAGRLASKRNALRIALGNALPGRDVRTHQATCSSSQHGQIASGFAARRSPRASGRAPHQSRERHGCGIYFDEPGRPRAPEQVAIEHARLRSRLRFSFAGLEVIREFRNARRSRLPLQLASQGVVFAANVTHANRKPQKRVQRCAGHKSNFIAGNA